jgi:hypothetical protein
MWTMGFDRWNEIEREVDRRVPSGFHISPQISKGRKVNKFGGEKYLLDIKITGTFVEAEKSKMANCSY